MKKIVILILFAFNIFTASSQSIINSYKYIIGYWNTATREWEMEDDYNYSDIDFNIIATPSKKTIRVVVSDVRHSVYKLIPSSYKESLVDGTECSTWDAVDEKGRNCIFSFWFYKEKNKKVINVMYDDINISYYLKGAGLSQY